MNLEVRMKTMQSSQALKDFIEDALAKRLGALAREVTRATVWVDDDNGPKGGEDKVCRVRIRLGKIGSVVVEHRSSDWYEAVADTTAAAGRLVRKAVDRKRKRRGPVVPLPAAA
jgi:ribosome-associated translation inhibitor RaiA